jgi:GT2 family glycosyltransferase
LKDISVIIVNYKGGERLVKCLESLQNINDRRYTFEVIVVDNQSEDGRMVGIERTFPQFTFVENTGNNGFANGCNLGASICNGTNLLFLNPDTQINSDALFDLLEEVRVRPDYSIVTCSQITDEGLLDRTYGKFLTVATLTGLARAANKLLFGPMEDSMVNTKHYIYPDWVSGSVLMIKKESFLRLGKWDEDFWMYFEDVDLCRRAKLEDGEIVQLKSAVVVHSHGGSSRIDLKTTALTKAEVAISRHIYISKHEKNAKGIVMHLLLIVSNLLFGILPASLGLILFFVRSLHVNTLIYINLMEYYLTVLRNGKWISPRSVNYNRQFTDVGEEIMTVSPPAVS